MFFQCLRARSTAAWLAIFRQLCCFSVSLSLLIFSGTVVRSTCAQEVGGLERLADILDDDAPEDALTSVLEKADDADDSAGEENANAPSALDSLLSLADDDISQLSRVRLAPTATTTRSRASYDIRNDSPPPESAPQTFHTAPSISTRVSTVSRRESTVGRSPAAVFVITNEMIRRSGATNIPDLLRLAPGVHVASIDSNRWSINVRGTLQADQFTNNLLVQIDGRTVYSPLFGGAYWDVQDVVLEDIDRIEVIRGPGASVWGVNAVSGVINIISKDSSRTQGLYVKGGAGTEERGFTTARYGGQIGEDLSYRVYGKWFDRDTGGTHIFEPTDDWSILRGGFRADWKLDDNERFKVQGDIYDGYAGQTSSFASPAFPFFSPQVNDNFVRGSNVLMAWSKELSKDSAWSIQAYFDRAERVYSDRPLSDSRDTYDLDIQRRFRFREYHNVVMGVGYRHIQDQISNDPFFIGVTNPDREDNLYSCFIQDEMQLSDDWFFTVGTKLSHNDYTGLEIQPTARLLWAASATTSVWGAVSRAVRTPARLDHDGRITATGFPPGRYFRLVGNPDLESEKLIAYELGMRSQVDDWLSWDVVGFYHDYDDMTIGSPFPPDGIFFQRLFTNDRQASSYGVEFFGTVKMSDRWNISGNYTRLEVDSGQNSAVISPSPKYLAFLHSSYDLGRHVQSDLMWRFVGESSNLVQDYGVMDARLAYHRHGYEVGVVGRNLLDGDRVEMNSNANEQTASERGVFGYFIIRR